LSRNGLDGWMRSLSVGNLLFLSTTNIFYSVSITIYAVYEVRNFPGNNYSLRLEMRYHMRRAHTNILVDPGMVGNSGSGHNIEHCTFGAKCRHPGDGFPPGPPPVACLNNNCGSLGDNNNPIDPNRHDCRINVCLYLQSTLSMIQTI
jgi:hypothetical protein